MPKARKKIDKKLPEKIEKEEKPEQLKNDPAMENETDSEKIEQEKKLLMWVGISCLMVIFFVVWIINLKHEFKISLDKGAESGFNWSQTKVELDKAMTQVKQGVAEIKKIQAGTIQKNLSGEPKLSPEQINLLKGKLLDEVATGTASSTRK
ncbi:MAG: hypothetical protein Q7K35_02265 [bacterium]|nr:hypothetical protein [bacterium]